MPMVVCPECDHRFRLPVSTLPDDPVICPSCGALADRPSDEDRRQTSRRDSAQRRSSASKVLIGLLIGCGTLIVLCGGAVGLVVWWVLTPTSFPEQTEDYAQARKHFQTNLIERGKAPQNGRPVILPRGVKEVDYVSAGLHLKAWVSEPPAGDQRPRPAVLFVHGGFAFEMEDWQQIQPFLNAGFVVMTPILRAENNLKGSFSLFYDEVDDVLAAADVLAKLAAVDKERLYVAGHSEGGTLALLAAMTSHRFRAAASFSGSTDQVAWTRSRPDVLVPFNRDDPREFQMRSPLAFPRSFKCPVRLYYGEEEVLSAAATKKTAELAQAANLDVEAISVRGDMFTAVRPAIQQCIQFFQQN